MKLSIHLFTMLMLLTIATAQAQEPAGNCEIVARVNGEPINRAAYLTALQEFKEELVAQMRQAGRSDTEIDAEFDRQKATVLESMIHKLLLQQRAEELALETDLEVQSVIIGPCHGIAPGYCHPLDPEEFEQALEARGIAPEQARAVGIRSILRHYVIQKEVFTPIYDSVTDEERRDYYEHHTEEFIMPAELTLSEVYLAFEGKGEAETLQQARELLVDLRAGADFAQAIEIYTPATRASRATGGQLGSFRLDELREEISFVVAQLNPGEFTEPILKTDGYMIIRLDKHRAARLRDYDDSEVQQTIARRITILRVEKATEDYLAGLRAKAAIETCLP